MSRGYMSLFVCFVMLLAAPVAQGADGFARYRLPSDLAVVVLQDLEATESVVAFRCEGGASEDPPGASGAAHLVEHLTVSGRLSASLEGSASRAAASTTHDYLQWLYRGPHEALDTMLAAASQQMEREALTDALAKLDFEREVVQAEFIESMSSHEARVWLSLGTLLYGPQHPYARPVVGLPPDISRLSSDTLGRRGDEILDPARCVLGIGGRRAVPDTQEVIVRQLGGVTWPDRPPVQFAEFGTSDEAWSFDDRLETSSGTDALWLAWPTGRQGHPEAAVAAVTARLLERRLRDAGVKARAGARHRALAGELWIRFEGADWSKKRAAREVKRAVKWLTGGFVETVEVQEAVEAVITDMNRARPGLAERLEFELECGRVRGGERCSEIEETRLRAVTVNDVIALAKTRLKRKTMRTLEIDRVASLPGVTLDTVASNSTPPSAVARSAPSAETGEITWDALPLAIRPLEEAVGWRVATRGDPLSWLEISFIGGVPEASTAARRAGLRTAIERDPRWEVLRRQGVEVSVTVTAVSMRLVASGADSLMQEVARVMEEVLAEPSELDGSVELVRLRGKSTSSDLAVRVESALFRAEFGEEQQRFVPGDARSFETLTVSMVRDELLARVHTGAPLLLYSGEGPVPLEVFPSNWGSGPRQRPTGPNGVGVDAERVVPAGLESPAVWMLIAGEPVSAGTDAVSDILLEALAGGLDSIFGRALEQEGIGVHTLRLGVKRWPESSRYRVLLRVSSADPETVKAVMNAELERVRSQGLRPEELARAKGSAHADLLNQWGTTRGVFDAIGRNALRSLSAEAVVDLTQERASLTLEAMNDFVAQFLHPDRIFWVVVGPGEKQGNTPSFKQSGQPAPGAD